MNKAITFDEVGLSFRNERPLEGVFAFLASRSKRSTRDLSASTNEIFKGYGDLVDELLRSVIQVRTKAEYDEVYPEALRKYAVMTLSLSRLAHVAVPAPVIEKLTRESICELEADFREKALLAFGATVRDQAIFTVWTLRKINDLVAQIGSSSLDDPEKQKKDAEYCTNFFWNALRAHFSLDCLSMALRLEQPIYPEVTVELVDELRAMVNAYAWARQGAALRDTVTEQECPPLVPDAEDAYLLDASMQDMASMDDAD
jgi:hypothetical protein